MGWAFHADGFLHDVNNGGLYAREKFNGDSGDFLAAISDFVVDRLARVPCELQPIQLKSLKVEGADAGVSAQLHASKGALQHKGCLLILIPGISCRAGVWGRSLCATDGLGRGAMFEFLRLARFADMAQVILDPNDSSDPGDGMLHVRHCVRAWQEVIEKTAAKEIYIVAHSFGGAAALDCLAVSSEATLARIRGIAFTDSVHFIGEGCVQLQDGGTLLDRAQEVLKETGVLWQADESPVDTELDALNEARGCRCVSAGVQAHTATNAFACCSIFQFFSAQSKGALTFPLDEDEESLLEDTRTMLQITDQKRALEVLEAWDMDKDGKLSASKLEDMFKRLLPGVPAQQISKLVKDADANQDGFVDPGEFVQFIAGGLPKEKPGSGRAVVSSGSASASSSARAKQQKLGLRVEEAFALPHGVLYIATGNICNFEGDAIVNAANTRCLGGGGVDRAISMAGGASLLAARKKLPIVQGSNTRCPTGEAKLTVGGSLKAPFCIHAVGPNYSASKAATAATDKLLASAYEASLACASERKLKTVAFPLLSAGIFRGAQSLEKVCELGIRGLSNSSYVGLEEVYVIAFGAEDGSALRAACKTVGLTPVDAGA